MALTKITKLPNNTVTSDKIVDNTIVNADVSPSAAISNCKTVDLASISSTLTNACASLDNAKFNVSLLGFKMAVNENLTVFNLVDGIVDEFHDESGTDESEGSNDLYCASNDNYTNQALAPATFSAGFTSTTVTEPDTSTAGTKTSSTCGTFGSFTVPTGMTSASIQVWGAGGAKGVFNQGPTEGGGGGYVSGTFAVSSEQSLTVVVGIGCHAGSCAPQGRNYTYGGSGGVGGGGGGLSGIFTPCVSHGNSVLIAGGGGGGGRDPCTAFSGSAGGGGAGGGLTGDAGGTTSEQTSASSIPITSPSGTINGGGGGDQEQGGQGGQPGFGGAGPGGGQTGAALSGGRGTDPQAGAGGGGGYYGGGGSQHAGPTQPGAMSGGGGGSSYYGHPQVTSGSTEEGSNDTGGGITQPNYVACTNEGAPAPSPAPRNGQEGYVLITGSGCAYATSSTTIVSTAFSANSVPTTSRIVVFEENVDTPTLNTDIIASISRDGGSNYTNATLSDSGYVTGSSGQRILTGQATISGQPSGQSMRWKLALANNKVKIHGVSLSWA